MVNIVSFPYSDQEKFKLALNVRTTVFVHEQKVDKRIEFDGKDPEATHYLAFLNGQVVGCARWRKTTSGIKLERFAVLPEFRINKIGLKILTAVLKDVVCINQEIYLNSQKSAIGFYLKSGFVCKGEPFFEAGIEHVKMIYSK